MAIKRRLTADTRIISRKDPALACAGKAAIEYGRTLDIGVLGDRKDWAVAPSVFTVKPLTPDYESAAYDLQGSDFWRIFAAHVREVDNLEFKLEFKDGKIDDKHREDFPPEVVMDISAQIIQLANKNDATFFGLQGTYLDDLRQAAIAMATTAAQKTVLMGGVKSSQPSTDPSKSNADTPQNSESK
jgi:hypothetical protein